MPSHKPTYGNFFEFKEDDIFHNRIKTYPKVEFFVYTGSVYYNNINQNKENPDIPTGHISLYDLNVNRQAHAAGSDNQLITPFVSKGGSFFNFKTISTEAYNLDFVYGDKLEGNYPLTASISVDQHGSTLTSGKSYFLYATRNALDYYAPLSEHYTYSSSFANKESQPLNIISVPSIFYGSSIKKGSVILKFYVTGSLIGEASDTLRNGRLIQTSGSATGHTVGLVMYNEGFLILTGSDNITSEHKEAYTATSTKYFPTWQYFASTGSQSSISSSYSIDFKGTTYIETMTMFAHAKENQLNFSNNPTFLSGNINAYVSSDVYHENSQIAVKNILSSSYKNYSASFKPVTYISKVGIYDKDKNLIAIAGLANPVRKLEERSYTFKLKLDI